MIKLVTYNILAECMVEAFRMIDHQKFTNKNRLSKICSKIEGSDVICLQEVDETMFDGIKTYLGEQYVSSLSLNACGRFGQAIFFKKNLDHIWEVSEGQFDDGSGRKFQQIFLCGLSITNCHLTYSQSTRQLGQIMSCLPDSPHIICGDFNKILNVNKINDFYVSSNKNLTNIDDYEDTRCIDYILSTQIINSYTTDIPTLDGSQPSDHIPVYADIPSP